MMKILFVCLGNICRSPAAEAILRKQSSHYIIDSAGTADFHLGARPYAPMQRAARLRGIEMSNLRARQFSEEDFSVFDLILVMDHSNLDAVEALRPQGIRTPVQLFARYASGRAEDTVPDPYYTRDFEGCLDLLQDAARGLLGALEQGHLNGGAA